jgi:hypothetical protein
MIDLARYVERRTLVIGDLNTGKTTFCGRILQTFIKNGYGSQITAVDLAPDAIGGIGGKLSPELTRDLYYVTAPIAAPRLTGKNETQILQLARRNARIIESLFMRLQAHSKSILFINDATLYLQAGNFKRLAELLDGFTTVLINAYYGDSFPQSSLTRREKLQTEALMTICDQIIQPPALASKMA